MPTGYLHAAYESIPGNEVNTPTLSTKVLYTPALSFQPSLNPSHLDRDDEMRGVDEPIQALSEAYDPAWELETRAYPDVLGFYLKLICGAPTTTAGNGSITDPDGATIPTNAWRHVFTAPYGPSGASPLTAQFQAAYKDESVFFKLKGAAADNLTLDSPASGGVMLKTGGQANYMQRISDPSLSATYEALTVPPFERSHITIQTWLTNTGTTEDFTVSVANPIETVRTLGSATKFPDLMEKAEGPVVVSGSIPKRHIDADDYDALLNATRFAVKVRWQSTVAITGSYNYAAWLECDGAEYRAGGPEALTNRRRIGASFDWKASYDGAGASSKWTVVNGTSSYV